MQVEKIERERNESLKNDKVLKKVKGIFNIGKSKEDLMIENEISMSWIMWGILSFLFIILSITLVNTILKQVTKPLSNIVDNVNNLNEEDDSQIKFLGDGREDNFSKTIN